MSPHRNTDSEIDTPSGVGDVEQTHRSLHSVVADRIRDAIVSGALYPGERLVEDRLAKELEVSRHPVREALRTLQLEGFVDISPRRGATVSRVTTEEGSELFEVLSALDGLSARLAATKRNDGAIGEIDGVLTQANTILQDRPGKLSGHDLAALAALNRDFHHCIASASANRQLIESITSLRDRIQWIQAAVNRRRPELSWAEHHQIRNAIAGQDADAAETLARSHIDAARVEYLAHRPQAGAATLGSVRNSSVS